MFRFRLRMFFVLVACAAVWFSTCTYKAGHVARGVIWFLLFMVSVVAFINYRRSYRWFWFGPASVLAIKFLPPRWPLYGHNWTSFLSEPALKIVSGADGDIQALVKESADLFGLLILSCICGLISAAIYQDANRQEKKS